MEHFFLRDTQFTSGDLERLEQLPFRFPSLILPVPKFPGAQQQASRQSGDNPAGAPWRLEARPGKNTG